MTRRVGGLFLAVARTFAAKAPSIALYGLPAPAPLMRLLVGDNTGNLLAEYRPQVNAVSWELSAPGQMSFVMRAADVREEYLQFGNRVLLQFDNGLPDWGGVLTNSREWRPDGSIEFAAAGLLEAMRWRLTPLTKSYTGTADEIIADLTSNVANFVSGQLDKGTIEVSAVYNLAVVGDAIEKMLEMDGFAFEVQGSLVGSLIIGTLNLWKRKSKPVNAALIEGHNAGNILYRESDIDFNLVHVIGAGVGWASSTRVMATCSNSGSVAQYGTREMAIFADEIATETTAAGLAEEMLRAGANIRRAVQLTVANREPGRFNEYHVGNTARVRLFSYGFGGTDRIFEIIGREYDPATGACTIVGEGE